MIKIVTAEHLRDTVIRLTFNVGMVGVYDLAPIVDQKGPMVQPLREPAYFQRFFLELGALAWPNGLDLSPTAIHRELAEAGQLRPADAAASRLPSTKLTVRHGGGQGDWAVWRSGRIATRASRATGWPVQTKREGARRALTWGMAGDFRCWWLC